MTMTFEPAGPERDVQVRESVAIDGAPVSYVVVLAAVVAGLAFVPLSVVLGSGKSFPMSQGIYPLVGWILGPIAGAVANGVGALVGVLIAPHTTTIPVATVFGATMGGLAAGLMHTKEPRRWWWLPLALAFTGMYALYAGRAMLVNEVRIFAILLGSFIDWSALLLFWLPTRKLAGRWIQNERPYKVGLGLFLGTWIVAGLVHLSTGVIVYFIFDWPEGVWLGMAPLAPVEHLIRCGVGAVMGGGVIAGLRAIGLVKPSWAVY
jgi:hypothetical protein